MPDSPLCTHAAAGPSVPHAAQGAGTRTRGLHTESTHVNTHTHTHTHTHQRMDNQQLPAMRATTDGPGSGGHVLEHMRQGASTANTMSAHPPSTPRTCHARNKGRHSGKGARCGSDRAMPYQEPQGVPEKSNAHPLAAVNAPVADSTSQSAPNGHGLHVADPLFAGTDTVSPAHPVWTQETATGRLMDASMATRASTV
jgi:hypothetical protein